MSDLGIVMAVWLHSLEPTQAEAEALAATAPHFVDRAGKGHGLTPQLAVEHVKYARLAGQVYGLDPNVLLSVAWHESYYTPDERTREPAGYDEDNRWRRRRVSCGVMTPVPKSHCEPYELTIEGGYAAGARHLRYYVDTYGSVERALVAYAGGGSSIRYPRAGWKAWRFKRQVMGRHHLIRKGFTTS